MVIYPGNTILETSTDQFDDENQASAVFAKQRQGPGRPLQHIFTVWRGTRKTLFDDKLWGFDLFELDADGVELGVLLHLQLEHFIVVVVLHWRHVLVTRGKPELQNNNKNNTWLVHCNNIRKYLAITHHVFDRSLQLEEKRLVVDATTTRGRVVYRSLVNL